MTELGGKSKTWILLKDGKNISNHSIDALFFTKVVAEVQHSFDNIARSKFGSDYAKEDIHLYINGIFPGSVAISVSPRADIFQITDEYSPYHCVSKSFVELISELESGDSESFRNSLEIEVADPTNRLGTVASFISLGKSMTSVYFSNSVEQPRDGVSISQEAVPRLQELKKYYELPHIDTLFGVMVGCNINKDYFSIKVESGREVRCGCVSKDMSKYLGYLGKWVLVTGMVKVTQTGISMNTVSEVSPLEKLELREIGKYELKKPLVLDTSYDTDDKIWGLVNEDVALYGYGEDYQHTLVSLEEAIEGHVISFLRHPDGEHTLESLMIKKRLQEYIDFNTVSTMMKAKYGESV